MAWIESHQGLRDHPKTLKLATAMEWEIDTTIGKLHRLWWWCLDYAADGNVSRHSADMIALAIGIPAEQGEKLIKMLYECEFLDKTSKKQFLIHDWIEYAGRYLRDSKYKRNPEKIVEIKNLYATIVSRHVPSKNGKRADMSAVPNQPTNLTNQPDLTAADKSALPEWIDTQIWNDFLLMRKEIKKPATDKAKKLIIGDLTRFKEKGYDPNDILRKSIKNNWRDVYEPKGETLGRTTGNHGKGKEQDTGSGGKYSGLGTTVEV